MKATQKTLSAQPPAAIARAYIEAHSNASVKNKDGSSRPTGFSLIDQTRWWNNFAVETRKWIDTLPVR